MAYIVQNMDDVRFTVPIKIKTLKLISEYKNFAFPYNTKHKLPVITG